MSSNQSGRNARQQELVKRLEEIRKNRRQDADPTPRHQMEMAKPRRNKKTQRQAAQSKRERNEQSPQTRKELQTQMEQSEDRERELNRRMDFQRKKTKKKVSKKKTKERSLIKQLSDGNKIADAMVLNEVLSKPIALRNKNR